MRAIGDAMIYYDLGGALDWRATGREFATEFLPWLVVVVALAAVLSCAFPGRRAV